MQLDTGTLNHIAENERHFHTIQASVRRLASSWVLAAFGGIAILLQQSENVEWLLPPFALLIVICIMANIGLSVLWIIDQMVYQRLFNTNYMAGLQLEQQFSFIPPVRAIQALTTRGRSIASWVKFFYVGPILSFSIIALVAAAALKFFPNMTYPSNDMLANVMLVGALLSIAPLGWVVCHAREVSFFRLANSLPSDFSNILKEENCRAIIGRHLQNLDDVNTSVEKTEDIG